MDAWVTCLWLCLHDEPIVGATDVMTSKSSTLPYDVDTMQKMINIVRKAKGTPKRYKGDTCN
jgi:hypothetical protein